MTGETAERREFERTVRDAVVGLGEGDLHVLDAELTEVEDPADQSAWRITLILPRPAGQTWDVEKTVRLRRQVRDLVDAEATRLDLTLDGLTSVVVTTQDSLEADIATEDTPEPEEGFQATQVQE